MSRILLIDAYSQIFRVFYAIRQLTSANGQPANALYGMVRLALQLEKDFPSDYGAMVFDKGKCARRTALLPAYKAQRAPMPEELRCQTERIRKWLHAFGWPIIEREGLEADDLLAGISQERRAGDKVLILTGDKDLGQLVKDGEVALLHPGNAKKPWEQIDEAAVTAKFGVTPSQLRDYLALLGDHVDNIPGLPGCGPKTAAKLLNDYGSIDEVLARLEELPAGRLKESLQSGREHLLRSRELVRLDYALPENWAGLETVRRMTPDWRKLLDLCAEEGFSSFAEEFQKHQTPQQLDFSW